MNYIKHNKSWFQFLVAKKVRTYDLTFLVDEKSEISNQLREDIEMVAMELEK
jgi:hypothetical protein